MVASGGDARAEWRPIGYLSPYWSALPLPLAYARLGLALPGVWGPRSDGYSLSKVIYDFRTSTRAPHVSAAPVRCRKVVYPGGCTARPGSSHVLQSAAPTGPSP